MKRKNNLFRVASKLAVPTLLLLLLASAASLLLGELVLASNATLKRHPGMFATWCKWNASTVLRMSLGNFFVYALMLAAVILFALSLSKIKNDKGLRTKSAILAICLFVPATLGLVGGVFDFMPHGYYALCNASYTSLETILLAFFVILTFILDVVYAVFAIGFVVGALRGADQVEEAKEEQPQQKECCNKEEREKAHEQLLKEIRQIVREELDRLDRVAIITETSEAPVEEEPQEEPVEEPAEEEAEASKIPSAPRVPFAKKMVDADKDIQEKYNELKNEILAYGPSSRLSVAGDTFRLHRKAYVKITLVGKTLKVYFALNPNDYVDSPIPVFDAGDKSAYEDVPALLKVRSDLSVKRAKELINTVFAADGVEKGEVGNHNFVKDIRAELKANKK